MDTPHSGSSAPIPGVMASPRIATCLHRMTRMKPLDQSSVSMETSLKRCLTTVDLTLLGIGSTVGSGIYLTTGIAAKELAGPGILVSFLLAAITVLLAAMCFTEFAARFPKTGSCYLYAYYSMGELPAFLVGWDLLIAYITGSATNARAWSSYLDFLVDYRISNYTQTNIAHWTIGPPVTPYPDLVAVLLLIILTVVIGLGVQSSSKFNALFVFLNVSILIFVMITGFVYADLDNWTNPDKGGFFPYGGLGVISGSAACFWAFTGFEVISVSVEEAKDPKKSVPISTGVSLLVVTLLYMGAASAITLMTPYYKIDIGAPLPSAFANRGVSWAKYIASIGPLCGMTTSLVNCIYGCVRICYAMADDGLLFKGLATLTKSTKMPIYSVLLCGISMCFMAAFFELTELLSLTILICLLQYMVVSSSVIIMRYRPSHSVPNEETNEIEIKEPMLKKEDKESKFQDGDPNNIAEHQKEDLVDSNSKGHHRRPPKEMKKSEITGGELRTQNKFWFPLSKCPPGVWVSVAVMLIILLMSCLSIAIFYGQHYIGQGAWWTIFFVVALICIIIFLTISIIAHRQNEDKLPVKVPCVPIIPCLSLFTCVALAFASTSAIGWICVAALLVIGFVLYFCYGISHSALNDELGQPKMESRPTVDPLLNTHDMEEEEEQENKV